MEKTFQKNAAVLIFSAMKVKAVAKMMNIARETYDAEEIIATKLPFSGINPDAVKVIYNFLSLNTETLHLIE